MNFSETDDRRAQICITGTLGSGKSTVGRSLADILKWGYVSTGSVQREIAQSQKLSTLELNRIAETDPAVDAHVDRVFQNLRSKDNIVVDSRMAWHFLPNSFKVRLVLSPALASKRILNDADRDAEKYSDEIVAVSDIAARADSERKRFINTYSVDITDIANYNLVIDTSNVSAELVSYIAFANYVLWKNQMVHATAIVSPVDLIPTQSTGMLDERLVIEEQLKIRTLGFPLLEVPEVLYHRDSYFIIDGHDRVCAAIKSRMSIIAVRLKQKFDIKNLSNEQFVADSVNLTNLYDWEAACDFQYQHLPKWLPS